jgi:hypothetical protein
MNSRQKKILIITLIVLLILGAIIFTVVSSGVFDACKNKLKDCNYGCGEGLLASICKEKCAYDYRVCNEN